MTKLSMTLAIASLTVSLAPSVNAYGESPEAASQATSIVTQVNMLFKASEQVREGQCRVGIEPDLAVLLGIDKPQQSYAAADLAMACHAK